MVDRLPDRVGQQMQPGGDRLGHTAGEHNALWAAAHGADLIGDAQERQRHALHRAAQHVLRGGRGGHVREQGPGVAAPRRAALAGQERHHERRPGRRGRGEQGLGVHGRDVVGECEGLARPVDHAPAVTHGRTHQGAIAIHAICPQAAGQFGDIAGEQLPDRTGCRGGDAPDAIADRADAQVRGQTIADHRHPHGIRQLRVLRGQRRARDRHDILRIARRPHRVDLHADGIQQLRHVLAGAAVDHAGPCRRRGAERSRAQQFVCHVLAERHEPFGAVEDLAVMLAQPRQAWRRVGGMQS